MINFLSKACNDISVSISNFGLITGIVLTNILLKTLYPVIISLKSVLKATLIAFFTKLTNAEIKYNNLNNEVKSKIFYNGIINDSRKIAFLEISQINRL